MSHHTILVVDDHPLIVAGCRSVLAEPTFQVISARDCESGLRAYRRNKPDVTIVDVNLPDKSGFELLRSIRKRDSNAIVIMLNADEDPSFALRAIESGALGCLAKTNEPGVLYDAVNVALKGERFLPPELANAIAFSSAVIRANPLTQLGRRELEILKRLGRGDRIGEIAETLDVSYKTVANTTSLLKKKLDARSHADLIRLAVELGLT